MFSPSSKTSRSFWALCGAALLTVAVTVSAQQTTKDYSPSDATGEVLGKYHLALEAKNYDGAIALLDAQIPKVEAGSYDLALLNQIKAQTLLQ